VLRDEAETYAPTLLEVATLALNRPLASLGLVGILESRHALRQRIERLVDFRPPRKAGLTLVSLLGIFVFSAVALPMGEGPARADKNFAPASEPVISPPPVSAQRTNLPMVVIVGEIYQLRAGDLQKTVADLQRKSEQASGSLWWLATPEQFSKLQTNLHESGYTPLMRPRIQTSSGMAAQFFVGNDEHGTEFDCLPVVTGEQINLAVNGRMNGASLTGAKTNQFAANATLQNRAGMVICADDPGSSMETNVVVFIGVEIVTNHPAVHFQPRLVPLEKKVSTNAASEVPALIQDGKLFFEMGKLDEADAKLLEAIKLNPDNTTALYYLHLVRQAKAARDHATAGKSSGTNALVFTGAGRQQIVNKLQSIRLDRVSFDGLPLGQVLRGLNEEARQRDDEHKGINFLIYNPDRQPQSPPAIDPATGLPAATVANASPDLATLPITIRPPLNNVTLGEVLDAVVKASPTPIYYSVEDFAVVFSAGKAAELIPFGFKLDARALDGGLSALGKLTAGSASERFKNFFAALGINWQLPRGKTVFYNDQAGLYFVQATAEDLDTIHRALRMLYQAQLQNASPGNATNTGGILADTNFVIALRAQQQRAGTGSLAEPEATTSSGRGMNRIDSPPIYYLATRTNIITKLDQIRLEKFFTGNAGKSLREVLAQLNGESKWRDPERKGIDFSINPGGTNAVAPDDVGSVIIKIPNLTDVCLADLLDAIVVVAEHPIKYSIRDSGVIFSAKGFEPPQLFMRTFRVDPNTFYGGLKRINDQSENSRAAIGVVDAFASGTNSSNPFAVDIGDSGPGGGSFASTKSSGPTPGELARKFFTALGINLQEPPGKSVFYGDRLGVLFVKATESDLDKIERALQVVNQAPPQIHIKAWFVEAPKGALHGLPQFPVASNSVGGQLTGILTSKNTKAVMQALQASSDFVILAEPEVTTTSGRQTQMRATEVVTVVTNLAFQDAFTNQNGTVVTNATVPQTSNVETGPILDVVPYVLSDGYTINLALIPSLTEFLGYDKSTNTTAAHNRAGEKINVPQVLPRFTVRQVAATLNLWDGQTAVLGGLSVENYVNGLVVKRKTTASGKELVIFVTATIVDPAGNRIHSDQGARGSYDDLSKPRSTQF
jgi:Flp pilus assembly secretin CpaC